LKKYGAKTAWIKIVVKKEQKMKLTEIVEKLDLKVFSNKDKLAESEVTGGYTSDLLSDVMGNAQEGQVWITLQNHKNVMAVASLKDLAAVVLVKGIKPEESFLKQSIEEGIPVLGTDRQEFEMSGELYNLVSPSPALPNREGASDGQTDSSPLGGG
jgi:serine kinase of HPr protein (carbohydrate metabolism regulator)